MPVSVVILAAGSSSRMGQSKQLLPWGNETLLTHAIKIATASRAERVFVVLGDNETAHRKAIETLPVTIVVNADWRRGMGSSIKAGLTAAKDSDAVLFMVCDMPFVTSQHLDDIIGTTHPIVASKYQDVVGVPALFRKEMFGELMRIEDSEGARTVIRNHKSAIIGLKSGEDLDTPGDYKKALSN
jgi:molybdenum cofactor cytidylyltransferase